MACLHIKPPDSWDSTQEKTCLLCRHVSYVIAEFLKLFFSSSLFPSQRLLLQLLLMLLLLMLLLLMLLLFFFSFHFLQ